MNDFTNFINPNFTYAVIGASRDPQKYGKRILKDLIAGEYKVVPINPNADEVEGLKAYASIADYQNETGQKIDIADVVVPPKVTEKILPAIKAAGVSKVWLQPGSESQAAIEWCAKNGVQCIHHACIMVQRRR